MPVILPTKRLEPKRTMPKTMLLYGPPKVGKSTSLAALENCLTLDTEEGHEGLRSLYVPIASIAELEEVIAAIIKKGVELKGVYPYRFIAVDTIDMLEKFCESRATTKYKQSTKGKNFEGDTVLELEYGLGYYFLREQVMSAISRLKQVCEHLILISHIRVKELDKGGITVSVNDISLTGKVASLVCNASDAIGYVYRDPKSKQLMVSFLAPSDSETMGCRYEYLAGKKLPMDWGSLFPEYKELHTEKTILPELKTVTV